MTFPEHLEKYLSKQEISELVSSFKNSSEHALLLNTNKMSEETFLKLFPNVEKHPFVEHGFIYNKDEYDFGKSIYHELGCFYLQEPSAMIVSALMDFNENDTVLDLCAAPGGKTIQAALKMHDKGVIYANDLSHQRASSIVENTERLGLSNVLVINNDFSKIYDIYHNYFTKIILDAPCSGSGMFRKDSKMIDDWSINKVLKFAEIQKELILMAYSMLKEGGTLSYSTCSYSYEEDEEVIQYLLDHTDAEIIDIANHDAFYVSKANLGIHLLSSRFQGEGHYIAQIRKPGILKANKFESKNAYASFLSKAYHQSHILNFNDNLFMLPGDVNTKKLSIVRYGVRIGEYNKTFIKYDYHYGRINNLDFPTIDIDEKEVKEYLLGNPIRKKDIPHGYVLIKFNGISVDLTKSDGQVIKNHYPKGLRKSIKLF